MKINTNVSFKQIDQKSKKRGSACDVQGCENKSTQYASVMLNGVNIHVQLCKSHAGQLPLFTHKIERHNANDICVHQSCGELPEKVAIINIDGVSVSLRACSKHAAQIGHVMIVNGESFTIPTFKCLPREDFEGGMKFWCPYCHKWHYHGRGNGHRVAHCSSPESPLRRTGYYIEMMSSEELQVLSQTIEKQQGV